MSFPLSSRRRAEDILVHTKSSYYFQVFSGVAHGFAVRGNPEVPDERECLLISLRQGWFGGTDALWTRLGERRECTWDQGLVPPVLSMIHERRTSSRVGNS